jgi:hypothetical protein
LAADISAGVDGYVGVVGAQLADAAEDGLPIGEGAAFAAAVRPGEGCVDYLPDARVVWIGVGVFGVAPEDDAGLGEAGKNWVEGYG